MKAPFSWPNNSEAISSRGIAEQFTLTNAREARFDRRWMARATSSLPVPVSPVMRTVESLGATLAALSKFGFRVGDRLGLLLPNGPEYVQLVYACSLLGVIVVPLNTRLSLAEIDRVLADASPHGLVRHSSPVPTVRLPRERVLDQEPLEVRNDSCPDVFYDPQAVLALIYTSGTTGHPKGVMVTHANVLANVQNFNFWMRYTEAGVYLHATPIFHIADFPCMFAAPAFGACQVTIPKFDPRRFCEAVDRERVSHTVLVPTMINLLTQFPEVKKYDLSSLQVLAYGGSPMPPDLIRRTRELLPQVKLVQAYGLSESGFLTGLQDQEHTDDRLLICGSQTIQGSRSKLESPASWWLAAPTLCGGTGIIQGRPRLRFEMALFAPETSATRILRGISTFWTG